MITASAGVLIRGLVALNGVAQAIHQDI